MARTNTIQQRFATLLVIAIAVSGSLVAARPLRILLEEGAGVATVAKDSGNAWCATIWVKRSVFSPANLGMI